MTPNTSRKVSKDLPWAPKDMMWQQQELKDSYDVVIIGAGAHGLATAFYLSKYHGINNVAVLEKGYVGGGNSGRNTAIIRSNYRTEEGIPFYDESVKLYENLNDELEYNVIFEQKGHITLGHTEASVRGLRERAERNQILGVESELIFPEEIEKLIPCLDVSNKTRYPIEAGLYHPPGGLIRHDPVVWGYAKEAHSRGVEIHIQTEVQGIETENDKVVGVQTSRGKIKTGMVVNATAGWCSTIAAMVGLELPIITQPLQAMVTETLEHFLETVIVSSTLHTYVNQADRGAIVIGASVDPYTSYSSDSTLGFMESTAQHALELVPAIANVQVLRQWAGVCDMTPDYTPVMGFTPVEGFVQDIGWGTWGFKASPICGKTMAELVATNKTPELIAPFSLERFYQGELVGEKAAASVGS